MPPVLGFPPAAGFTDSVVRVYNLGQMGNARAKLPKYHKHQQLQAAKRLRGLGGELEPGIDVDTEMAELQVGRPGRRMRCV